jgi:8-oxo-dGTP diphosphatase
MPRRRERTKATKTGGDPRQSEKEFLATYDASGFDRPSVAVDVVLLSATEGHLWSLLLRRDAHPHRGRATLPGGFFGIDESLDDAARRVLAEKTGLEGVFLEQLYTFGAPQRDPRTRVISVAYYALVPRERLATLAPEATVVRLRVDWEGETGGPVALSNGWPLAFDHADILGMAVKRIRGKLDYSPIGFQLLPEKFTLLELQRVHETVLGRPVNKDSFRRRMLASGQLEATGESQRDVVHRPAELYRFTRRSAV